MAAEDIINLHIREHNRHDEDGLPNEPVNAPLPIGDPNSGVYQYDRSDLRAAILAAAEGGSGGGADAAAAAASADEAEASATAAATSATEASDDATAADASATEAQQNAAFAAGYRDDALTYAQAALGHADDAEASAAAAAVSAQEADDALDDRGLSVIGADVPNDDIDDIAVFGSYRIVSTVISSSPALSGIDVDSGTPLFHFQYGSGNAAQILAAHPTGNFYSRVQDNGTWSDFKLMNPPHLDGNVIVSVPSDFPTLQAALDAYAAIGSQGHVVTVNIESGYTMTEGVDFGRTDFSGFQITSDDATVPLAASFSGDIFTGSGSVWPRLDCVIDAANQISGDPLGGQGNTVFIAVGGGIINGYGSNMFRNGNVISADGAVITGAAQNGTTGAAMTAWGSIASVEGADLTGSDYYGGQAAHGGILAARFADASDAGRYGFRATDMGIIDLDGATANDCGEDGVRIFNGSIGNGRSMTAQRGGSYCVSVTNGSVFCGRDGIFSDSLGVGALVNASLADFSNADLSGAALEGLISNGSLVRAVGADARRGVSDSDDDFVVQAGGILALSSTSVGGLSQQPNILTPSGIIFDSREYTIATISFSSNRHDWDPLVGIRSFALAEPTGATRNVTGLVDGTTGKQFTIFNVSASQDLGFNHNDASSTLANRFLLPGGADFDIGPGGSATFMYTNDAWRLMSAAGVV